VKSPEVTNRQTVVTTPDVDSAPTEDPVLAIMPPKEIPVNAAFAPVATSTIVLVPSELASGENGAEIVPPDNPDHDGVTSLEDELFQFKKPQKTTEAAKTPKLPLATTTTTTTSRNGTGGGGASMISGSTGKSSRALALARRREAENNVAKNMSGEGQIDRTEVSMSDVIFVGGACGHHEMDYTRKMRERREAKERATTISQLSKSTSSDSVLLVEKPDLKRKAPQVVKPKVRLDENGEMVVDKSSLYVQAEDASAPLISDEVLDEVEIDLEAVNSMSFKKRRTGKRSKNWTEEETDRFYEAVTIVGNDVNAIATAFSRRSLSEVKRKFKREEKQNMKNISELLKVHESGLSNWDLSHLVEKDKVYYEELEKVEEEKKRKREEKKKKKTLNNNEPKIFAGPDGEENIDDLIPDLKTE